ncbi:hypothetical protein [Actinacidiphila acididurans]|uniref:Uncharacterized protein n=1 Tax=Actinacidiphila acididurans TaxID=2784346 RepID=A0ABS2TJD9_9ACTN|nr:hypothetical protein [Actinacidiphila acididurans]MBM9503473.1 hypothetical protein [Actinacidiphila acididurans]
MPCQAGQTLSHDYVIAVDRFGAAYPWPSDSGLAPAGSYDSPYAHMTAYWDGRLAEIAQLALPDPRLFNAYKAGMIYGEIVKDGTVPVPAAGQEHLDEHGRRLRLPVLGERLLPRRRRNVGPGAPPFDRVATLSPPDLQECL